MANITSLSVNDFLLKKEANGQMTLCLNRMDPILIFFKSSQNTDCNRIEPQFMQLANSLRLCLYGICNVTTPIQNQQIVQMSRQGTKTPIQSLPMFVFYYNGRPFAKAKWQKPLHISAIKNFVEVSSTQLRQQLQTHNMNMHQSPNMGIQKPTQHIQQQNIPSVDSENSHQIEIPSNIIPYNNPWRSDEI